MAPAREVGHVVAKVSALAEPLLRERGLEMVELDFKPQGRRWFLRLFVDKEGGVTLDDCLALSRELGYLLDAEDPIKTSYVLEVSSPGLDRPLRSEADFRRYAGRLVKVSTYVPVEGRRQFTGRLLGLVDQEVALELDEGRQVVIPYAQVAKARLEVEVNW